MKKDFKIVFVILVVNIILLMSVLVFITLKKLEPKTQTKTLTEPTSQANISPELNYKITKWKIAGKLNNEDIDYDFRNGLGGDLSGLPSGTLIDGDSIWLYSKKLRQILTEVSHANRTYRENDQKTQGYVAVINRVSNTKLTNAELWKIFDKKINLYHFNLVDSGYDVLPESHEAQEIFKKTQEDIKQFFQTLQTDPTVQ